VYAEVLGKGRLTEGYLNNEITSIIDAVGYSPKSAG
jgi:hypothetical protein